MDEARLSVQKIGPAMMDKADWFNDRMRYVAVGVIGMFFFPFPTAWLWLAGYSVILLVYLVSDYRKTFLKNTKNRS